jgi:hypothetical protein
VAHGNYCQLPDRNSAMVGIFRDISQFLFIYSTISLGNPKDVCGTVIWKPRYMLSVCTRSLIKGYVRYMFYAYISRRTVKGVVCW